MKLGDFPLRNSPQARGGCSNSDRGVGVTGKAPKNCSLAHSDTCVLDFSVAVLQKHMWPQLPQMALDPHLATAGVERTSVPPWEETGRRADALSLRPFLKYFHFRSRFLPLPPSKPNTSGVLPGHPQIRAERPLQLPRGEQTSGRITSFARSYTPFPLLLIVLASMTSLTFSGVIPLFSLPTFMAGSFFPLSCIGVLSASALGCLEPDGRRVGSRGRRGALASSFCRHLDSNTLWNASNSSLLFLNLEIHETYFLSPPSPSTSLHLTFYSPHFAINLLFVLSNELIRVS